MSTPPLPPAVAAALAAAEMAGEQARLALIAAETAGNTETGEPGPGAVSAHDLPFAGDADQDVILDALHSLTARINASPRTPNQWREVGALSDWIGAAVASRIEDDDEPAPAAGTSPAASLTPARISQIRREAASEHRTHEWADRVIEELLAAVERRGEATAPDLSHAALVAILMDAGGSVTVPADAFERDALGGPDGAFHAIAMEPLTPTGRLRISVQPRPDIDGAGIRYV